MAADLPSDALGTVLPPHREIVAELLGHAGACLTDVVVDANATLPDGRPGARLTVADDGAGIPEGGRHGSLRNLARRAESLGGDSRHGRTRDDGGVGGAPLKGLV